ncbi:immunoglobulin-like domain-containing protein [Carnobacterium maltaromaticum]|uniref:immunoglobulin-like domain-containing protein n=1 Tax=Carnobacterium maltaromaticum TaxID=2751 RepID=UPI0012F8F80C|nr:immunoglobulin-like domain-containing protein [Carnobacterium maltaromaticum]
MEKNNKPGFKMTKKGLRQAVTISAVVLTLAGPTMPIIANAAVEAPAVEAPAVEAPAVEAPAVEAPAVEAPAVEAPAVEAPAVEAPAVEAPAVEAPAVEAPAVEAPAVEAPAVEAPAVEAPAVGDVHVSTYAEFKVALNSVAVKNIYLDADITIADSFNFKSNKNVYGDGHTINVNNKRIGIALVGAIASLENVNLINQSIYSFFWSEFKDVTVNYKNVTSSGNQFVWLPNGTVNLSGNIFATATLEEGIDAGKLNLKSDSNVTVNVTSSLQGVKLRQGLDQEAGSVLNVSSKGIALHEQNVNTVVNVNGEMNLTSSSRMAFYHDGAGGQLNIASGAKFKAIANDPVEEAVLLYNGSLNLSSKGTLVASSIGTQSTIQTGNSMLFENGSNFSVTNTNTKGPALGSWAEKTNVFLQSDRGIGTWAVGGVSSDIPNKSYSAVKATFTLKGYTASQTQTNMTSNNSDFQMNFKSGAVGKITGGTFAQKDLEQTTINDLTTDSTQAVGTAEPNADILIKVGTTEIGKGKVGSDGKYSIKIPKQTAGVTVKAIATLNSMSSEDSTVVKQANLKQTTINDLTTDSTQVVGTAEPNADISIKVGTTEIGKGRVGSDGIYSVTIPKQVAGVTVKAIATLNSMSSEDSTVVKQANLKQTTINDLTTDSTQAVGTAEPNADISIKVGTTEIGKGRVGSDGIYSVTIPKQVAGVTVKAIATLNSMSSEDSTVVKQANLKQTTINDLTTDSTQAVGTAEPNADISIKVGTTEIGKGRVGSDGKYSITILKQAEGVTVKAIATLNSTSSEAFTVVKSVTAGTITPATYKVGSANITGTYTGDVKQTNLIVNGKSISWGGTFAAPNFSHFVQSNLIKAGDNVVLVAYDANGKELDRKTVTVESVTAGTITPATYKVGSANITGTYTGDVKQTNLIVNGKSISWGGTFTGGNFTFYALGKIKAGDNVVLVAYDANGKELDRKPVEVEAITAGAITPAKYTVGDTNITGTYTGDVKKAQLIVNDKAAGWGGTFTTGGTFTYYAAGAKIKAGDKVVLVGYDANDKELDRKTVTVDAGIAGAVTSAMYKIGDSNITGTFTGDVARVQLKVNGVAKGLPAGTFKSDGTFTYWAKGLDIKASDDVTLTALDIDNNQLQESFTVVLNDSEGTVSDVSYKVGDSNITGKFTGDVARVQLKINGDKVGIPAGTFNPNGTFSYWAKSLNIQATDEVTLDALDNQNNVLQADVVVAVQE